MSQRSSYNVAVIGAGAIAPSHIQGFQKHPAARVVALADLSPERGQQTADKFDIPEVVTDYRALLAREDIHVVSIALPNYLHVPVALEAVQAGKHVLVEKPIATSAADAARLVQEADRRGLLLMVGQNARLKPEVQTAKQLVEQGALGEVYHAKTALLRRSGIPRIGSWFTQSRLSGGGCVYDIGVHALDRALFLLGEFEAACVSGQTYAKFGPRGLGNGTWGKSEIDPGLPFDVDDLAIALIKLRSGRTVLLEASWAAHLENQDGTQLFGTEAGLRLPPLQILHDTPQGYKIEPVELLADLVNPDRMAHFIDVLLGQAQALIKPGESLALQRILDAIYESARTGHEVRLA